jgi:hypothetical protein
MTHTTTATIDGHTYTATSTLSPVCQACVARMYASSYPDADDSMTAQDWQQVQTAAAERAQRADDAALYNTGRDGSDRGVGY